MAQRRRWPLRLQKRVAVIILLLVVTTWQSLRGLIDEGAYGTGVFDTVEGRLKFGASEAKRFSSIIVDYFANLTHVPPTERGR